MGLLMHVGIVLAVVTMAGTAVWLHSANLQIHARIQLAESVCRVSPTLCLVLAPASTFMTPADMSGPVNAGIPSPHNPCALVIEDCAIEGDATSPTGRSEQNQEGNRRNV